MNRTAYYAARKAYRTYYADPRNKPRREENRGGPGYVYVYAAPCPATRDLDERDMAAIRARPAYPGDLVPGGRYTPLRSRLARCADRRARKAFLAETIRRVRETFPLSPSNHTVTPCGGASYSEAA